MPLLFYIRQLYAYDHGSLQLSLLGGAITFLPIYLQRGQLYVKRWGLACVWYVPLILRSQLGHLH